MSTPDSAGRPALNAADILEAADIDPPLAIYIPEWGGTVHVRQMTGTERDAFELFCMASDGARDLANVRAKLAVFTVCDPHGKLLFRPEQAAELGRKSGAVLSRLFDVAAPLNGITEGDTEALLKNSEGARSGSNG